MNNKLLLKMLAALLLVISFANGHASRSCTPNKPEPTTKVILASPAVHFGPLDMFKW